MKCINHFSLKKKYCFTSFVVSCNQSFSLQVNQLSGTIFRVWPRAAGSPDSRNSMETAETIWKLKKKVRKIERNVCPNYFNLCFLYPNKRSVYCLMMRSKNILSNDCSFLFGTPIINARRTLYLKICLPTEETVRN
jgi:hypothetical protein